MTLPCAPAGRHEACETSTRATEAKVATKRANCKKKNVGRVSIGEPVKSQEGLKGEAKRIGRVAPGSDLVS